MSRPVGHSLTEQASEGLRALSAVRKVFPDALLAGGYLRDIWYGRPVKDIDIFIEHRQWAEKSMRNSDLSVSLMQNSLYQGGDVAAVFNLHGFDLPAQVIMLTEGHTPLSRIREHDFDFCQIWHDGWSLGCTVAFNQANFGEVTLVHCEDENQFDRSMRRWDRLKEKYPDFKLVIPPRYRHFLPSL